MNGRDLPWNLSGIRSLHSVSANTNWKPWLGRLLLLALITPSTIVLMGLALMSLGLEMMAEM